LHTDIHALPTTRNSGALLSFDSRAPEALSTYPAYRMSTTTQVSTLRVVADYVPTHTCGMHALVTPHNTSAVTSMQHGLWITWGQLQLRGAWSMAGAIREGTYDAVKVSTESVTTPSLSTPPTAYITPLRTAAPNLVLRDDLMLCAHMYGIL
jgi:hypothetical protein